MKRRKKSIAQITPQNNFKEFFQVELFTKIDDFKTALFSTTPIANCPAKYAA